VETKIQRWGNSLGLRIPKALAVEAQVEAGSTVDLTVEEGKLIVRPVSPRTYDLDALLAGINARNLHEPVDTDAPVGREAW
jgi:antitoxin MazE